ncbi:MAG: hypothetical protein ACKVZJ_07235 [Phycisphaerales bacterium]
MQPKRPTYSEHWHRVEHLRPRLRVGVRSLRRSFRGEAWHILEDPLGAGLGGKSGGPGAYFRLNDSAYRFIALLDGRRTVAQAWTLAGESLGDDAPTQPEAVALLGQLASSNLLQGDLPEDATALFRRYRARRGREIKGALASLLSIRIPLVDPDRFLTAALPMLGLAFSRAGLAAWCGLLVIGLAHVAGRAGDLVNGAGTVLAAGNLVWLYGAFLLAKVVHELGHGVACKRMAAREGSEAPVHAMGVMLLVFMPAPYVDATSAWLIRSKWRRIVVGAAGMYAELALAALAAIVWARTAEGSVAHAVAYNLMFVAGVSTLIFNANPLMKYDGYFMLADALETPNLAQRAREQTHHLVQRRCWKVRDTVPAALTAREGVWLVVYHLASGAYRWVVFAMITLFVMDQWLLAGVAIGVFILVAQGVVPLGKLGVFLASSPKLNKSRPLATWSSIGALGAVLGAVALIPVPDRARLHGVVTPGREEIVFAPEDGFIESASRAGESASASAPLVKIRNGMLESERAAAGARVRAARLRADRARVDDPLAAQQESDRAAVLERQREEIERRVGSLNIARHGAGADKGGGGDGEVWCGLDESVRVGAFVRRGERLGKVLDASRVGVDTVADQNTAARLLAAAGSGSLRGELRARGAGGTAIEVRVRPPSPAGRTDVTHHALADHAGGPIRLAPLGDGTSLTAAEPYFDVRVEIPEGSSAPGSLTPGRRVVVRVDLPSSPLLTQWVRAIRQTFQERFGV